MMTIIFVAISKDYSIKINVGVGGIFHLNKCRGRRVGFIMDVYILVESFIVVCLFEVP